MEMEEMENIVAILVKRAGERIFHVLAPALYVCSPEDGIWVISFEGISVTGKIYVDSTDEQLVFEVIKVEGQRKLVGLKYTI